MSGAIPWIQAASMGYGLVSNIANNARANQQQRAALQATRPTWDQAWQQAASVVNPQFDQQLQKTLQASTRDLLSRGMFGQLPGAALTASRLGDVEQARLGAIGNLAAQIFGQGQQSYNTGLQLANQYSMGRNELTNQWLGSVLPNQLQQLDTPYLDAFFEALRLGQNPFTAAKRPTSVEY